MGARRRLARSRHSAATGPRPGYPPLYMLPFVDQLVGAGQLADMCLGPIEFWGAGIECVLRQPGPLDLPGRGHDDAATRHAGVLCQAYDLSPAQGAAIDAPEARKLSLGRID